MLVFGILEILRRGQRRRLPDGPDLGVWNLGIAAGHGEIVPESLHLPAPEFPLFRCDGRRDRLTGA